MKCPKCDHDEVWDSECPDCGGDGEDEDGDECEYCDGAGVDYDYKECPSCGEIFQ